MSDNDLVKLRPVGRNILIKPFKDSITYKGLHLPDTAKQRASDGIVLACGGLCQSEVCVGDWVIFSRKQATDVEGDCVIVDERACMVFLDKDESSSDARHRLNSVIDACNRMIVHYTHLRSHAERELDEVRD